MIHEIPHGLLVRMRRPVALAYARKDAALICRIERTHWRDTAWALRLDVTLTTKQRFARNFAARNAARRYLAGLGYSV
jgi:hypothetical protein